MEPSQTLQLLRRVGAGDTDAGAALFTHLGDELRRLAARQLGDGTRAVTLQPTLLVDEAWLELVGGDARDFADRRTFFAFASRVMRHVVIDAVRARRAQKRGSDQRVTLQDVAAGADGVGLDLLAVDDALEELGRHDPEAARVVELRFYGGLALDEIALELGLSERTVDRRWRFARAWLSNRLEDLDPRTRG